MREICFLFGAGADNNYDKNLPMGRKFAEELLLKHDSDAAIKKFYNDKITSIRGRASIDEQEWLPEKFDPTKFNLSSLAKASLRKKLAESGNKTRKEINNEVKASLSSYPDKAAKEELVKNYPNYINQIDGRMHTIIRPKTYGATSFCAVVSLYARAYIVLCHKLLEKNAQELLENYSNIVDDLNSIGLKEENTYYHALKDLFKDKSNAVCVVTTNYTPFAEKIIGLDNESISYPHGKLGWFENPYRLEVYDAAESGDRTKIQSEFVFPYIFLQSGVKPVVDPKQIDEYKKTKEFLIVSQLLFICGYAINEDDNHLNSLLRRRIISGMRTIYIHYNVKDIPDEEIKTETYDDILKKLRITDTSNIDFQVELIKKTGQKDVQEKKDHTGSVSEEESPSESEQFESIVKKYLCSIESDG